MVHCALGNDIDTLTDSDALEVAYSQLESGAFSARTLIAQQDATRVTERVVNRSHGFRGQVTGRYAHLRFWGGEVAKVAAGGVSVGPAQVLLAFPAEPLDVTVIGPSRSIAMTIAFDVLAGSLGAAGVAALEKRRVHGLLDVDERALVRLLRTARSALTAQGGSQREGSLTSVLVNFLDASARSIDVRPHAAAVIRPALNFMNSHLNEALTLQELCEACGWSKRTMIYHFSATLGITPMAYFKLQRLNALRRALKYADAQREHVVDVAATFGFYHLGHLASDYRDLFGVLPSQTLGEKPLVAV